MHYTCSTFRTTEYLLSCRAYVEGEEKRLATDPKSFWLLESKRDEGTCLWIRVLKDGVRDGENKGRFYLRGLFLHQKVNDKKEQLMNERSHNNTCVMWMFFASYARTQDT